MCKLKQCDILYERAVMYIFTICEMRMLHCGISKPRPGEGVGLEVVVEVNNGMGR